MEIMKRNKKSSYFTGNIEKHHLFPLKFKISETIFQSQKKKSTFDYHFLQFINKNILFVNFNRIRMKIPTNTFILMKYGILTYITTFLENNIGKI